MDNSSDKQKRIRDVKCIFEAGNTEIKTKSDLPKIIEEPCLAVCEDLYDKNILTYWSSSNQDNPDKSFVLIRYESLDDKNKAIADKLLEENKITEDNNIASHLGDNYGKGICLSIDSNADMLVSDVSDQLKKLASVFEHQDILYNTYSPQDLLKEFNSRAYGEEKSYKFPHIDSYAPFIIAKETLDDGSISFSTQKAAQHLNWLYDEKSGNMYKDEETLRRHNTYLKLKEKSNENNQKQALSSYYKLPIKRHK